MKLTVDQLVSELQCLPDLGVSGIVLYFHKIKPCP